MKKYLLPGLAGLMLPMLIMFSSCKKSGGPGGGSANGSPYYLASARNYSPGTLSIDSFDYNGDHLLTRYAQYIYDTSYGSPVFDSLVTIFSYNAGSQVPASYVLSHIIGGTTDENHLLAFDGQNRLIRDSCIEQQSFVVTHYTYSGENLVAEVVFSNVGFLDNQLDTLYVNNGNVVSEWFYYPNSAGTADTVVGGETFQYSNEANPLYHTQISGPLGHLLFILSFDGLQNFVDFNSKYLASSSTLLPSPRQFSYNYTTDSRGRVVKQTSPQFPAQFYYVTYTYY